MQVRMGLVMILLMVNHVLWSQEQLSLQQAIDLGLQNNYGIRIARYQLEMTENLIHPGMAGMLPSVQLEGSYGKSSSNTKQEFITGNLVDKKNANSNQLSGAILLNWKLFNGLGMFATLDKMKYLNAMEQHTLKMSIQQLIVDLSNQFALISRDQQQIHFDEQLVASADSQLTILKKSFAIGLGRKSDVLLAEIELRRMQKQLMQNKYNLNQLKYRLNELLGRHHQTFFELTENDPIFSIPDSIFNPSQLFLHNLELQFLVTEQKKLNAELDELRSGAYPELSLNVNYTFNKNESQAGFLLYNQNHGWNANLGLQWNLYNGSQLNTQITNAKINLLKSKLALENSKLNQEREGKQAFDLYSMNKTFFQMELNNSLLAKEHYELILNNYLSGESLYIEVKEARNIYEVSLRNMLEHQYQMNVSAIQYLQISGNLVKS